MSTPEVQADNAKCSQCGKASDSLQKCGRCKTTCYCSKECQVTQWPTHKTNCKRPNYLLHFHLCPDDIDDPPVTRTLSCPATATFHELHSALQIAFSWANTHAYDFAIPDPTYDPNVSGGIEAFIQRMTNYDKKQLDPNLPREFLLRISAPANGRAMLYQVDRMHETLRKHPRTVEKDSQKARLFHVLDDDQYAGMQH